MATEVTHFDTLFDIMRKSLATAQGEIYCLIARKQKRSSIYARNALLEVQKACEKARKDILEVKKSLPIKKKKKEDQPKD